jgi:integrase
MASVSITTRTRSGKRRFVVRYRLGGRAYPNTHGGSFKTLTEARQRRDVIAGELAAGRNPAVLLASAAAEATQKPRDTFRLAAEAYTASRVDVSAKTAQNLQVQTRLLNATFGEKRVGRITTEDVQAWIAACGLKPASVRGYMSTLRAVLDYAKVDPNPARDSRVRLPKLEQDVVSVPSAAEVAAILAALPRRWHLSVRVLAETGMRVGELSALEWRDVDEANSRFRIRNGKTRASRRWVAVPLTTMVDVLADTPPDDRTTERRVFGGASPTALHSAMYRACRNAGIAQYGPHSLRHRYASLMVKRSVPVTELAAQLGHARNSMTLDVYSHVLVDD